MTNDELQDLLNVIYFESGGNAIQADSAFVKICDEFNEMKELIATYQLEREKLTKKYQERITTNLNYKNKIHGLQDELEEIKSRSCKGCKYWVKSQKNPTLMKCVAHTEEFLTGKTFYCSNWEKSND